MPLFGRRSDNNKLTELQKRNNMLSWELSTARQYASYLIGRNDITSEMLLNFKWNDPDVLTYYDYFRIIETNPVAEAIIYKPARQTWKKKPYLVSDNERIVESIMDLIKRLDLFTKFEESDRNAYTGEYSVIVLGMPGPSAQEITRTNTILWAKAYKQGEVKIKSYDMDPSSQRYGQPLSYLITGNVGEQYITKEYHWSRVIHIAREGNVKSLPFLKSIFNTAKDAMKVSGAGGEAVYRAACMILAAEIDKDSPLVNKGVSHDLLEDEDTNDDLEKVLIDFMQGAQSRGSGVITGQGAKFKGIQPRGISPVDPFDTVMSIVAMKTGYPKRTFMGNEAGELASSEDRAMMNDATETRQTNFAIPFILNNFINHLIYLNYIPAFKYDWKFNILSEPTDKEKAETSKIKSETLYNITRAFSLGLEGVISMDDVKKLFPELQEVISE